MSKIFFTSVCILVCLCAFSQPENRWQQRVNYKMDIEVDAPKNQCKV